MKVTRVLLLATVAVFLAIWVWAAQDKDEQQATGKNKTVTGCLAKGDSANEFYLTGDDGKKYEVRSDAVNLADHVGHKVTVNGATEKEAAEKDRDRDEDEARENVAANLKVSSLQMVNSSCK